MRIALFVYNKARFVDVSVRSFLWKKEEKKVWNPNNNNNNNENVDWIIGNHAIGTVRKFPTLPLNANGVWIDPAGGVWRQAAAVTKDGIADYAQVSSSAAPTLPLPDYER